MQPRIDIYYNKNCGACTKAIEFLHKRGVDFHAYAVEYDHVADRFIDSDNTREMYRRCREEIDFVPQVFVGATHIAGWMKLGPMTTNGEFDKLIASGIDN